MILMQFNDAKLILEHLEKIREILENEGRSSFEVFMICGEEEKDKYTDFKDKTLDKVNDFENFLVESIKPYIK